MAVLVGTSLAATAAPAAASPLTVGQLDGYSPKTTYGCDRVVKPGTEGVISILRSAYPGYSASPDTGRACSTASDHARGTAIDWSVRAGNSDGQQLLNWLFEGDGQGNSHIRLRRLGISYIIWNDRIWTATDATRSASSDVSTWKNYDEAACFANSGSGADCLHVRHMHISLGDRGADKASSWWQPVMDGHRDLPNGQATGPAIRYVYSVNNGSVWEAASNTWLNQSAGIVGSNVAAISVNGAQFVYTIRDGVVYEAASNNGWINQSTGILASDVAAIAVDGVKYVYTIRNGVVYEAASNNGWISQSMGILASELAATSAGGVKYVYTIRNGVVYEAASNNGWISQS
ncbi:hypothetical protein AB6N24_09025, partial [Cellulomonas sp. 179-A 4D5 NHS]